MKWIPDSPERIRVLIYAILWLGGIVGFMWGPGNVWSWLIVVFGIGLMIALAHRHSRSTMPPRA